jgi:excisionase family DNA binding protein
MVKIDPDELLTVTQAAELRGVTRQAINHLIRQGKMPTVEIAGRRFVRRKDVEGFEPDRGGRPKESREEDRLK